MEATISRAPGWGFIKPHDLTPDFVQFVNGLHEIQEAKHATAHGLRHFKVKGFCIEERFLKHYYDYVEKGEFEAQSSDVYIVSFPKTGTTWIQEIIYMINTDFDYEKANSMHINDRFPFMEVLFTPKSLILDTASQRHIKSHLPLVLLPPSIMEKKCKVIYIARNPKDTIVSYYHFYQLQHALDYKGTFVEFVEYFTNDFVTYAPYDVHTLQFWEIRNEPNILFLKYEDLHKDLPGVIRRVASFLGKPVSDEQVFKLSEHCSFQEMKHNPACNDSCRKEMGVFKKSGDFFRKGIVGDWKSHFNEKTNDIIEKCYNEKLKFKGLIFDFEV